MSPPRRRLALVAASATALLGCGGAEPLPERISFNRHIRPILSNSCLPCHGPDGNARQADLPLDVREIALSDRDGVRAIVPGDPAGSELVRRIRHPDPEQRMPPRESERTLSPQQAAVLERWIEQGAVNDSPITGEARAAPITAANARFFSFIVFPPFLKFIAFSPMLNLSV